MILVAYDYFKEFEVPLSLIKKTYETVAYKNVKTTVSEVNFKAIKLDLDSDIKEELGLVDGGCELLVKFDSEVVADLKQGAEFKYGDRSYIVEKIDPSEYSDCRSFICKEVIYG
ncbi:hypothetical protein PM10SUCC1_32390 [Propionigenium maris DSM 9537]|uniref:Uncharacterized protein n=1 Tax=Propionigenium maris DSM 9537 TaxID=1123000 RepID=A0A9W6LQ11_9FUSO|nr:hypothetical protein [Propionigenium maris]GLI57725.1 hypothetical protein PM10SUCC1_32390 [Propionigenium maris DSM 9537]